MKVAGPIADVRCRPEAQSPDRTPHLRDRRHLAHGDPKARGTVAIAVVEDDFVVNATHHVWVSRCVHLAPSSRRHESLELNTRLKRVGERRVNDEVLVPAHAAKQAQLAVATRDNGEANVLNAQLYSAMAARYAQGDDRLEGTAFATTTSAEDR